MTQSRRVRAVSHGLVVREGRARQEPESSRGVRDVRVRLPIVWPSTCWPAATRYRGIVENGGDLDGWIAEWEDELREFARSREEFLLYRD